MTLEKFATHAQTYRNSLNSGVIADVARLAPTKDKPLRFRKIIRGDKSTLVDNEQRILNALFRAGINNVVHLEDYSTHNDRQNPTESSQTIVTQSAGVDLQDWFNVGLTLVQYNTPFADVFFHPSMLLNILKYSLQALYGIHQFGIVHCDIKLDNICLPYDGEHPEQGNIISLRFDRLSLIDFGHSHWHGNSIGNNTRYWLGMSAESDRYQSRYFLQILQQLAEDNYHRQEPPFQNHALEQIDYSCDLYSLGFAFNKISNRMASFDGLVQLPPWSLIWQEYQGLVEQLLAYDNGKIGTNMPHEQMIVKIDSLLNKLEQHYGYSVENIAVRLNEATAGVTPLVSPAKPSPILSVKEVNNTPMISPIKTNISKAGHSYSEDVSFSFDRVGVYSEGLASVVGNGKYGFIDVNKKVVIPIEYDSTTSFYNGHVAVCKNGFWGMINKLGEIIIPLRYEKISSMTSDGLIKAKKNYKWGVINRFNETVIPFEHDDSSMGILSMNKIHLTKDNQNFSVNSQNEVISESDYAETYNDESEDSSLQIKALESNENSYPTVIAWSVVACIVISGMSVYSGGVHGWYGEAIHDLMPLFLIGFSGTIVFFSTTIIRKVWFSIIQSVIFGLCIMWPAQIYKEHSLLGDGFEVMIAIMVIMGLIIGAINKLGLK